MDKNRIELLEKYISDEPENPFNRYALAMEYYENIPEKAQEILEKAIQQHPDYLPIYFKLAHLYWEDEDWDKAETTFKIGIDLAAEEGDQKALKELKSAYLNFEFEKD